MAWKLLKVSAQRIILPLDELKEYEFNHKVHWTKQIEWIKEAIERFSYIDEITIDKNNVIILWHWRYRAIKEMWYKKAQVKQLNMNVNDAKALRHIHNAISEYDITYKVKNIQYEINSWVDFSIWNISTDDLFSKFNLQSEQNQETWQINQKDASLYEKQQDEVDDIADILAEMEDTYVPETNSSVVRRVQINVKYDLYSKVFAMFKNAINNKINLWEHLIKELKLIIK